MSFLRGCRRVAGSSPVSSCVIDPQPDVCSSCIWCQLQCMLACARSATRSLSSSSPFAASLRATRPFVRPPSTRSASRPFPHLQQQQMASSSSAAPTSNGIHKNEEHQFGWAISDKIVHEVNKQESVPLFFDPALSFRYFATRWKADVSLPVLQRLVRLFAARRSCPEGLAQSRPGAPLREISV